MVWRVIGAIAVLAACARPAEPPPAVVDVPAPAVSREPVRVLPVGSVTPLPRAVTPPRPAALAVTIADGDDEQLADLVRMITLMFAQACMRDTSAPPPWSLVLDLTLERRPVDQAIVRVVTRDDRGAPPGCADALTRAYVSGTWPNGASVEKYRVRIAFE